jgi:hypothetical protein
MKTFKQFNQNITESASELTPEKHIEKLMKTAKSIATHVRRTNIMNKHGEFTPRSADLIRKFDHHADHLRTHHPEHWREHCKKHGFPYNANGHDEIAQ